MDISNAIRVIKTALSKARRPAVLWSGGKDSTVLLSIVQEICPNIEVIHWKLPFLPEKYTHHHKVQENLNMTVHDWVPVSVALTHGKDRIDVCETYSVGDGVAKVMRGTEPFEEGKPWVCGKEWLNRPKAHVVTDFDVLLCGHKNCDEDPLTGPIPLELDIKMLGATTSMWFPIKSWSNSDIADYILNNNVSYDTYRYDCNVVSKPDKYLNSDYVHSCFHCVDKREGQFVHCPKLDLVVENLHEHVLHEQPVARYCNVRNELPDLRSVLLPQVELADLKEGSV